MSMSKIKLSIENSHAPTRNEGNPSYSPTASVETSEKTRDAEVADTPQHQSERANVDTITVLIQVLGALAAAAAGTARPLMTVIFGGLVNTYNSGGDIPGLTHRVDKQVLILLFVFIGQWTLVCSYGILFSIAAMRQTMKLRASYLRSTVSQDIEQVSESRAATDLSTNISLIEDAFSEKFGTFLQAISTVITSLVIAFTRSWRLTLVMLIPVLLLLANNFGAAIIDAKLEQHIHELYMQASSLAEECISGIRAVTACLAHSKLGHRYASILDTAMKKDVRKSPISAAQYSITYFVVLAAYGLGFWYGTRLYITGEIRGAGSIVIVILCMNQVANALLLLLPVYSVLAKAKVAYASLSAVIHKSTRVNPFSSQGLPLDVMHTRIEFQDVEFVYPSRPTVKVFKRLNISFGAGKTTAVVGQSGSGKSTLVSLLERWYDPTHGNIMINGQHIGSYNVKSLRSSIRVVQQDSVLFNDTIYNNVVHGLIGSAFCDFPESEKRRLVVKVCKEVQAHDFIQRFPHGYDTVVGNRGMLLSGGQRQRVAIARAIISNPVILIFDEATSALDGESEQHVQVAIDRVSRGRTTIMIAHNLATVKRADRIILLKDGEVDEEGTHHSLLRTSDTYTRIWMAQNLASEDRMQEKSHSRASSASSTSQGSNTSKEDELAGSKSDDPADGSDATTLDLTVSCTGSFFQTTKTLLEDSQLLVYVLSASATACVVAASVYPAQSVAFGENVTSYQKHYAFMLHATSFWSLVFFLIAIGALFSFFAVGALSSIGGTITARLYREQYFRALLQQPIVFYDNTAHTPGFLLACLSSHPSDLQGFVATLSRLAITAVNLSSTAILGLIVSWRFALVALFGSLPVVIFAGFLRVRIQAQKNENLSKPLMDSAQYAAEVISNIRTVSAFAMEEEVCRVMAYKMNRSLRQFYRSTFISMPLFAFSHSGYLLGMTLGFWYSGHLLAQRKIEVLHLWIVFVGIVSGSEAVGEFFASANSVVNARTSCSKISRAKLSAQKASEITRETAEKPLSSSITFDGVSFAYQSAPTQMVLNNVSFEVVQGQKIAIVGPTGSGKSTIISLLERFYDVAWGQIHILGKPLSGIDVEVYRSNVSLVSQETQLFGGTVRENILLGIPEGEETDEELFKAARDAHIHDFIMSLPEGYNTACGKKGITFSGGQRQRLAIARALVRKPSILLLDEATSALDTESEMEVKKALNSASQGRTTIAVAHRLSTIQDADRILVLVKGSIVEQGSHDELTAMKGVYWTMCQKQNLD